ncbi:septum formation family protein [Millisia brevis]|uniref:septum formation family protein n=1 Tax=Millisia brevis TaxID=264148 RepID=UPI0012EDE8E0|nr:septum formation family protein [Millisia brevis]
MTSIKSRVLILATLAAAAAGVAGCSSSVDGTATAASPGVVTTTTAGAAPTTQAGIATTTSSTTTAPSTTVTGQDTDIFAIRVGDCLTQEVGSGTTSSTEIIPCSEPHSGEIYASFNSSAATFPGTDAMNSEAEDGCVVRFTDFVGIPWQQSTLAISYFVPTNDSWDLANDREILCIIEDPAGPTSGTLQGSNR